MIDLPHIDLAFLPTPVESLEALGRYFGGPRLFIKRDDLTGLAFGGNKTRKLEYLLSDAHKNGTGMLITTGAVQSNHCRQTAAAAAKAGLDCTLILTGHAPVEASGNVLLDLLLGANLVWAKDRSRDDVLQETFDTLAADGQKPYLIPYGGSNALGAAAYAFAVQELFAQDIEPDWILFPTSSGGTQAGLVAGTSLLDQKTRVLGISVDESAEELKNRVAGLAGEVCSLLGASKTFKSADIRVNEDYLGGGYGVPGGMEIEAIQLFARLEGILLDPVYSGRAAAGLIDLIRNEFFEPNATVLFWHTGGTPALFADRYQDIFSG